MAAMRAAPGACPYCTGVSRAAAAAAAARADGDTIVAGRDDDVVGY